MFSSCTTRSTVSSTWCSYVQSTSKRTNSSLGICLPAGIRLPRTKILRLQTSQIRLNVTVHFLRIKTQHTHCELSAFIKLYYLNKMLAIKSLSKKWQFQRKIFSLQCNRSTSGRNKKSLLLVKIMFQNNTTHKVCEESFTHSTLRLTSLWRCRYILGGKNIKKSESRKWKKFRSNTDSLLSSSHHCLPGIAWGLPSFITLGNFHSKYLSFRIALTQTNKN